MPSPIDTLLRVHDSPVPTQIFFEFFGSIAITPIDCTGCSSNTGRKRVPPSSDFQIPPLAAPTKRVILPEGSFTPVIAEIRPLIVAEPILRAPSPEIVAELNGTSPATMFAAEKQITPINIDVALILTFSPREKEKKSGDGPRFRFLSPTLLPYVFSAKE